MSCVGHGHSEPGEIVSLLKLSDNLVDWFELPYIGVCYAELHFSRLVPLLLPFLLV